MIETNILKLTKSNTVYNVDSVRLNNNEVSSIIINNNYKWTSAPKDTRLYSFLGQDHIGHIPPFDGIVETNNPAYDARHVAYQTSNTNIDDNYKYLYKGPIMLLFEYGTTKDEVTLSSYLSGNIISSNSLKLYNIDDYGVGIISNILKFNSIYDNANDSLESIFKIYCGSLTDNTIKVTNTPYSFKNSSKACPVILWTKGYSHKNIRIPARFYYSIGYASGYDLLCLYLWSSTIQSYCYNDNDEFNTNNFEDDPTEGKIVINKYENQNWNTDDVVNNTYSSPHEFVFSLSDLQTDLYDYNKSETVTNVNCIKFNWMINLANDSNKYRTWHFSFGRCASISFLLEYYSLNRVYVFDNSDDSFKFSTGSNQTIPTKFLTEWLSSNEEEMIGKENFDKYLFVFQLGNSYVLDSGQINVPRHSLVAIPKGETKSYQGSTTIDINDYLNDFSNNYLDINDYLNTISNIRISDNSARPISRVLWGTLVYDIYNILDSTNIIKS